MQFTKVQLQLHLLPGDFNINLLNSSCGSSSFLHLLGSCQILLFITLSTRITASTLIDNIFASPFPYSSISGNLTTTISDHLPFLNLFYLKPNHLKISNSKHEQSKNFVVSGPILIVKGLKMNLIPQDIIKIIEIGRNDLDKSFDSFFT